MPKFDKLASAQRRTLTATAKALASALFEAPSEDDVKAALNAHSDALDAVDAALALQYGWDDPPSIPAQTAKGGASFEDELRWALDATKRGENKLAVDRLTRILKGM